MKRPSGMRIGSLVRVKGGYRNPYLRGRIGIVRKSYGALSYTAFEVDFGNGGQSKLFWREELEEAGKFYQQRG
jgi:hypothetical protein